jgi:hypothetical protein
MPYCLVPNRCQTQSTARLDRTRPGIGDSLNHAEADGALVCVVVGNWPDRIVAVTGTANYMQSDSAALKQATTAYGALNPPPSHCRQSGTGDRLQANCIVNGEVT